MTKAQLGIVGLLVLMAAHWSAAEPSKQDSVGIQGTWKILALEADGEAAPGEIVSTLKLVFKGDTLTFTPGEPGFTNYKYKLEPATNPAGFSMTHADGSKKGEREEGIYLLEGNRLKICFGKPGKVPNEFTAKAGSGQSMYSLERMK